MMRGQGFRILAVLAVAALIGGVAVFAAAPNADNGNTVAASPAVGTQGTALTPSTPWVAIPDCPVGVSRPAGAVVDGHFFVIGGEETGGARTGYAQEYDPVATTWDNTNATMPTPGSNLCAAVIGGDIYVPGGYDGTYLTTLQAYTPATDSWQTVTTDPLPAERSGPACAAWGGKLYVFGGVDSAATYTTTTYIYDPAAAAGSRWSTGAAAPVGAGYGDAIAVGDYLYYSGIRDSVGDLTGVYRYDPVDDSWTTMPALSSGRGGGRMWTYEGKLAVGGGGWASYLTSVEEYDLSTGTGGTWTAGNSIVSGRRTFAAAQDDVDGVLYLGAGWAGAYLTSAESSTYVIPVELMGISVD